MAFTSQEEANIRLLLLSFQNGKGIADLSEADHETLSGALIEVLQNGVSKKTSIANFFTGSPAGTKASLAALEADFPDGEEGTYVTSDTGHWYFWNGSTWEDGGLYQAPLDNVQTFSSTILVNPHTAGKTPRFLGDVAINTTTLEIWKANALTAAVGSWSCISEGYKAGRVITKAHGLSAITQTTFFTCYGALAHADRPTDLPAAIDESCYGLHINSNVGDTSAYQMVIGYTTGVKYERRKVSGTWGAWIGLNVANNLTTTESGYTLDARQGKALNDAIALKENAANKKTIINDSDTEFPTSKAIRTQVISLLLPRDYSNNRATNKRYHSQLSPLFTQVDNIEEVSGDLMSTCRPCIIDRNAAVVSYLDKNDVTKLESGSVADLTLWNNPVMLQYGGFYSKYEYDAGTNEKIKKISLLPIKGYTYHKRRFRGLYDGTVVTNSADGSSKSFLTSNAGVYSTHDVSLQNFHAYAKNLGPSFRAMSWQDHEILTWLFWIIEGTTNSQAVYRGIVDVDSANWAAYNKSADGGQPTYGQFHLNGITNDIVGHKGEKTITVSDFPNGAISVKPHKYLWCENALSGPYYLLATGRLFSNDNVYEFKDLSKIAFTVNSDASLLCSIAGIKPDANGWQRILETYRDTLVPEVTGGSDTTGYCDQWYGLASMGAGPYVPMLRGYATDGSSAGLGLLRSHYGPAHASASIGAVLAADDPSDPIPDGWVVS